MTMRKSKFLYTAIALIAFVALALMAQWLMRRPMETQAVALSQACAERSLSRAEVQKIFAQYRSAKPLPQPSTMAWSDSDATSYGSMSDGKVVVRSTATIESPENTFAYPLEAEVWFKNGTGLVVFCRFDDVVVHNSPEYAATLTRSYGQGK